MRRLQLYTIYMESGGWMTTRFSPFVCLFMIELLCCPLNALYGYRCSSLYGSIVAPVGYYQNVGG